VYISRKLAIHPHLYVPLIVFSWPPSLPDTDLTGVADYA
jgi:hypothetical protein